MSEKFFRFLFGDSEGYLCIATIFRPKNAAKEFNEEWFEYPTDLDKIDKLISREKTRKDIYYCPHLFAAPGPRKKENVSEAPSLWADVDECPTDSLLVKPSVIVRTSVENTQALWRMRPPIPPEMAESICKRIARFHKDEGMDQTGWDLTQLLRVPKTYNHKYNPPQSISVEDAEALEYVPEDFDSYPVTDEDEVSVELSELTLPDKSAEDILEEYKSYLNPRAFQLFSTTPTQDWSRALWELEVILLECGLSSEETFVVAREAKCNKYARDDRPEKYLWAEVVKASKYVDNRQGPVPVSVREHQSLTILSDEEREAAQKDDTFVEWYIDWAKTLGDAAWQYHQAGAFIILSSLLSGAVKLPTSFGTLVPNLWFMILADTTLTRKTTAMDIAIGMLTSIDPDAILATDGSIEGLMTAISTRPNRPSIFLRDEFTGLVESMSKREYYAGMLETLTKLYDGKFLRRILRKETIEVRDPILILFAGGIKTRMMELLNQEHVISGFIPRFIIITADADVTKLKPIGPPTSKTQDERDKLLEYLQGLHDHYWRKSKPSSSEDGTSLSLPKTWNAELTDDAWFRYNQIEMSMVQHALKHHQPSLMTPTMDRLCKSGLKCAVLIAASRNLDESVVVTVQDIVKAFFYVEQWQSHTIFMLDNIGISADERKMQQIVSTIHTNPGVMRSDIMRHYRLSSRETEAILSTLQQRGVIERRKENRTEKLYPLEVK